MKLAVCLLALAAVAFSQQTPEVTFNRVLEPYGDIGYPNRAYSMTKTGANFFGNFYVPASERPTVAAGRRPCIKIILKPDNPTSRTAQMKVTYRPFFGAPAQAQRATPSDYEFISMSVSQPLYTGIQPFSDSNGTIYDGIALGGFMSTCDGCFKSADFVLTALVGVSANMNCPADGTGITWAPFPIIDSRATWVFDASPSTGYQTGPVGGKFTLTNPTDMYLLSIPASSSTSVVLAMSNTATTPSAPSDIRENGPNVYVSPFGSSTRNGEVRSGRIPQVAQGTWWVHPWVNSGSSWSFAVGFGAEPAAAGMLVPSMLLAAILAVVAMLL